MIARLQQNAAARIVTAVSKSACAQGQLLVLAAASLAWFTGLVT